MTSRMKRYYSRMKEPASGDVAVGDFYAVLEDDSWRRVQCVDFDSETETAVVRFIDEGYEEVCKADSLYPLDKEFCALPIQVISLSLSLFWRASRVAYVVVTSYVFYFFFVAHRR